MRYIFFLWISLISGLGVNAQNINITEAVISFEFPYKDVSGTIQGFESQSTLNWDNPESSSFRGSVEAATLDTNNGLRNWSLRGSKYFDVKAHPKLFFSSSEIKEVGNVWIVNGKLTIKGITKPFEIRFEKNRNSLVGRGELYASDFDINIKKDRADNLVKVKFEFELDKSP